jgi:hypothetical protein
MLQKHPDQSKWTSLLRDAGKGLLQFFSTDMTDTKWGHRVMDQIFREGKFDDHAHGHGHPRR